MFTDMWNIKGYVGEGMKCQEFLTCLYDKQPLNCKTDLQDWSAVFPAAKPVNNIIKAKKILASLYQGLYNRLKLVHISSVPLY